MDVLKGLNKEQKEAVLYFDSPLLVLAGAGSGKTRVITHKIMYLIKEKQISLNRILAITFTNKAAKEMKERVKNALNLEYEPEWISTFHSISAKILRIEAENLGYKNNFVIYDEEDSKKTIKDIVKEMNLSTEIYKADRVKNAISQVKQEMDESIIEFYSFTMPHLTEIYEKYQKALKESNALDFDDLLVFVVKLFKNHEEIRKKWQNKFDYILVDEYQDTNKVQHEILKYMVGGRNCITVVGDPQQCIYTWRGANPENILEFEKDFPNTKIIKLERNYRSTGKILSTANKVISGAKVRWKEKILKLWTDKEEGEDIGLYILKSDKQESDFIGREIKRLTGEGYKYSKISVLMRMSFLSRNLEEAMMKYNIPYQIIGGVRFYERAEVKDILAYLRFALNPNDTQAFKRIINLPARGIGEKTVSKIQTFVKEDWLQGLTEAYETFSPKIKMRIQEFLEIIEYIQKYGNEKPSETAKFIFDEIGYEDYLVSKYPKDWEDRIANIEELFNALKEVEKSGKTLSEFLEESSLVQAQDNIQDENSVKIMTIHASKGLEFPVVFIAGLEEGIFPSRRAFEDIEQMEEERRLFYVAITRAEEKVYLTYPEYRYGYNGQFMETKPSRFVEEIKPFIKVYKQGKKKIQKSVFKNSYQKDSEEREYKKVDVSKAENTDIKIGELVKHDIFGKGVVKQIEGNKALVIFENVGEKKILTSFLKR